jgi:DDE domain
VDRAGRTVDFRLSAKRDVAAAKAFFRKAIKGQHDAPRTITLDGYAASHRAVRELKADGLLPAETKLRSSKYLNNLIEQDHRYDKGSLIITSQVPVEACRRQAMAVIFRTRGDHLDAKKAIATGRDPETLGLLGAEGLSAPGTQGALRGLPGGAEGIRTSDLRSAGTRAVDGAAACASAVTASCGYPIREKGKSRGPRLSLDVDSRR